MKNKLKISKKQILEFLNKIKSSLLIKRRWILLAIVLAVLAYCGFLWYKFVSKPQWNNSKKQEYINTKENKVKFDQGKFDKVISEIEKRKNEYNNKVENITDIFRLK